MSANEYLTHDMAAWAHEQKRKTGRGILPAPLPTDFGEAADVWIHDYQKPRQYDEQVQKTTNGEVDPYISRLRATLSVFLNLTDQDRTFIRAAIEDGVEWRGDAPDVFADIYDQTMKMRQGDRMEYIKAAILNAKRTLGIAIPGPRT